MAGLFNKIPTDLDLNGPILSITTEPTGVTGIGTTVGATGGASVSISGVATAVVGSSGSGGTGYLSYQWYEEGVGALSNGTYITGTASTGDFGSTTTLTLSNLITPTDNNRKFYFTADYIPSYTVGVQSVTVPGYTTGNAWNDPISSGLGTVTVTPLIDIIAQPTNIQAFLNSDADITVNADLSDSAFSDDLQYQWYLNGELATDGVKTVSTTTGTDVSGTVENTYSSDADHQLPAVGVENLEMVIGAGGGGSGGRDGGGPGGPGGRGRVGRLLFPDTVADDLKGNLLKFKIGRGGNGGGSGSGPRSGPGSGGVVTDSGDGGRGGTAGARGWSGAGGGGGAATYVQTPVGKLIVAGGGGGGGGGSHHAGGDAGAVGLSWSAYNGYLPMTSGDQGGDKGGGDGGGGGGGGGGSNGGEGGRSGQDRSHGGGTGAGGGSRYNSNFVGSVPQSWENTGDGFASIKYTGYTSQSVTTVTNTTLSGTTTDTLTIKSDSVGVQTCQCKITSATASNSPIWTDTVNFVATNVANQYNVNVEGIGIGLTANLGVLNLANGDFTVETSAGDVSTGQINREWVLYSPDQDLDVEMDLYGGKGTDNSGNTGGEGGYSRIRFTMTQNTEYVIAGLTTSINTPFLYKKAQLIACVGAGGDAGTSGKGGFAGGVDIGGERGASRGGIGGNTISAGSLSGDGSFGSAFVSDTLYPGDSQQSDNNGGFSISCTKGVYWAQQGIGACDNVGTVQFRQSDGTLVTNTSSSITRGYKAGYNIIQTAGIGAVGINAARGGNGCRGGSGGGGRNGTPNNSGGGGGGGYTDGSVTVVSATAGGSTGDAKIVLRLQS